MLLAIGKATEGEAERATQLFSNIALAHKNAQLFPDAIAYARRAIAIAPPVRHVSLGRDAEAIEVLQKAFDLIEEWAREDAHNAAGRMLFASAGRELGNLLRQRDPPRALAIYERALLRFGEIKDNAKARRGEVDLLTGSAYPLRRLGRSAEAL